MPAPKPSAARLALIESARLTVANVGYNLAADILGIKHWTLRKWAQRYNWNVVPKLGHALDASRLSKNPNAYDQALQALNGETKLKSAVAAHKAFDELAGREGKALVSGFVPQAAEQWSRAADRVHGWTAERAKPPVVAVQVNIPTQAEVDAMRKDDALLDAVAKRLTE